MFVTDLRQPKRKNHSPMDCLYSNGYDKASLIISILYDYRITDNLDMMSHTMVKTIYHFVSYIIFFGTL